MWGSGVFQPQHIVVQRRKTGSIRLGRSEKVPTWVKVVRALCHEVIVLRDGLVVETGPTEAIFERPETEYTQALLAAALDLKATETGAVRM